MFVFIEHLPPEGHWLEAVSKVDYIIFTENDLTMVIYVCAFMVV